VRTVKGRRLTDRNRTSFDPEDLAVDEDIGDLPSCGFDDPAERLPRDIHPDRRLFLVQPFEIGQADCLVFVEGQKHLPAA
jgi:hypothetical protein